MEQQVNVIWKIKIPGQPWEDTVEYQRSPIHYDCPEDIVRRANAYAVDISYSHQSEVRWNVEDSFQGHYVNAQVLIYVDKE